MRTIDESDKKKAAEWLSEAQHQLGMNEYHRVKVLIRQVARVLRREDEKPPIRRGKWDESEREVLRKAHADFNKDSAVSEAAKHLSRTESQIRAMSKNMGLR